MGEPEYLDQPVLSGHTTLGLGGPARRIALVDGPGSLARALEESSGARVAVLGSGSNLVVADRGFDGLLIKSVDQTREYDPATGELHAGAGLDWDRLVRYSVERGAGGLECLSGIPGLCGAAPVQNIGAYGQEVGDVLQSVQATHLATGENREFGAGECALGYRRSRFKVDEANQWAITSIRLRLRPGGAPTIAYRELQEALSATPDPGLGQVRETVLGLRRRKSMVYDPSDPNHRSAGSFFTNPVVDETTADRVADSISDPMPRWPAADGGSKLAAAWLIERAGFAKGYRHGPVGLSSNHVLALVNHGQAKTVDLLALARTIRDGVLERFGVRLSPEPVPLGFEPGEVADLWVDQPDA